jgi:GLPGLI family protein
MNTLDVKMFFLCRIIATFTYLSMNISAYCQIIMAPDPRDIPKHVVDTCNIRVWYALSNKNEKEKIDLQVLEIGRNISKYYSYIAFISDSLIFEWRGKRKNAQSIPTDFVQDKTPYWSDCYKDFKKDEFTEYLRTPPHISEYKYLEKIPEQKWELLADTLSIFGYLCQKAVCKFRGREYIAWFTVDIPISNGPWKFGGLPGLIMKIYDTHLEFIFEFVGIDSCQQECFILMADYNQYIEISREKGLEIQKNIQENYFKFAGYDNETLTINGMSPEEFELSQKINPIKITHKFNTMLLELE